MKVLEPRPNPLTTSPSIHIGKGSEGPSSESTIFGLLAGLTGAVLGFIIASDIAETNGKDMPQLRTVVHWGRLTITVQETLEKLM